MVSDRAALKLAGGGGTTPHGVIRCVGTEATVKIDRLHVRGDDEIREYREGRPPP